MRVLPAGPAAEAVRREVHDHVLGLVARRVRRIEDAEDITQDVMLRLHRTQLEGVEHVGAWVHRVAVNAITDHYRRAARRELPSGQVIERRESTEHDLADTDGDDLRRELAECLTPLIERLPPIPRRPVRDLRSAVDRPVVADRQRQPDDSQPGDHGEGETDRLPLEPG